MAFLNTLSTSYLSVSRTPLALDEIVEDGLVTANNFLQQSLTHPAQGSAEFNGTSDYVQLPTSFSHTNHTIAAWVYVDSVSGDTDIFDNRDANDDGIRLTQSGGTIYYQVNTNDRTTTLTAKKWFFVTASYDGTTANLYLNGSLKSSNAPSPSQTIDTTTDARIGARSYATPTRFWDGNLANVSIWNRALTSDEINSVMWKDYNALSATEKSGLQAWYSLDDIDGTSVPDSSGNGNEGTAN